VAVLDETLLVWEKCSDLIVPPIPPDGPAGVATEGQVMSISIDEADGGVTLVAVAYEDPTCRAHAVVGPIIDQLLATP
jgi:hypothetical protein